MNELRTFIVEDDELFALLHSAQAKKGELSDNPETYRHGLEAIRAIEATTDEQVSFLVLLDINMPIMNGWEFLDHIQGKDYAPRLKIAMVSSSINESDRRKAFSYPQVIEFIQKPFRREDCLSLMAMPQLAPYYNKNN